MRKSVDYDFSSAGGLNTALHWAVYNQFQFGCQLLLNRGADLTLPVYDNLFALHIDGNENCCGKKQCSAAIRELLKNTRARQLSAAQIIQTRAAPPPPPTENQRSASRNTTAVPSVQSSQVPKHIATTTAVSSVGTPNQISSSQRVCAPQSNPSRGTSDYSGYLNVPQLWSGCGGGGQSKKDRSQFRKAEKAIRQCDVDGMNVMIRHEGLVDFFRRTNSNPVCRAIVLLKTMFFSNLEENISKLKIQNNKYFLV